LKCWLKKFVEKYYFGYNPKVVEASHLTPFLAVDGVNNKEDGYSAVLLIYFLLEMYI